MTEHGEVTWQTDVGQVRLGHRKLWVTSIAGEHEVRVECLPGSSLPATLRKIGYQLTRGQDGQRILPVAVTQEFVQNADGALAAAECSTRAIIVVTHHAGISAVEVWTFKLP